MGDLEAVGFGAGVISKSALRFFRASEPLGPFEPLEAGAGAFFRPPRIIFFLGSASSSAFRSMILLLSFRPLFVGILFFDFEDVTVDHFSVSADPVDAISAFEEETVLDVVKGAIEFMGLIILLPLFDDCLSEGSFLIFSLLEDDIS